MTLSLDIVKPPAKTEYELEKRRENRWHSDMQIMNRYRKVIKVTQL